MQAEVLEKLVVSRSVVFLHIEKFVLDFLFDIRFDELKLTVVLNGLTRYVELKFAVHKPFDETEVIGQQIRALFGDKHAVGV